MDEDTDGLIRSWEDFATYLGVSTRHRGWESDTVDIIRTRAGLEERSLSVVVRADSVMLMRYSIGVHRQKTLILYFPFPIEALIVATQQIRTYTLEDALSITMVVGETA